MGQAGAGVLLDLYTLSPYPPIYYCRGLPSFLPLFDIIQENNNNYVYQVFSIRIKTTFQAYDIHIPSALIPL